MEIEYLISERMQKELATNGLKSQRERGGLVNNDLIPEIIKSHRLAKIEDNGWVTMNLIGDGIEFDYIIDTPEMLEKAISEVDAVHKKKKKKEVENRDEALRRIKAIIMSLDIEL